MDALPTPSALLPVSEDAPAGPDLRQDYSPQSLYLRLRDARSEARAAERQADAPDEAELRKADLSLVERWRLVRELAARALDGTRDLEIGAWYVEALLRCDGLPGFTLGVNLLSSMAGEFWDAVYPLPDEDGLEARVAPIAGLNGQGSDGTLMQPLRKLPLFARPDGNLVALWQYEQSAELESISDPTRRQQRLDAGVLAFETLETEARFAGGEHFASLLAEVMEAMAAWQRLSVTLDTLAGADSPPTGRVRDVLVRLHEIASTYAEPADAAAPVPMPMPDAVLETGVRPAAASMAYTAAPSSAPLGTREDALRALEGIAAFFLRTEPLSPLSYTLQDAVRRGRMTWPELLAEIVPDWTTRATILTSLGIKPPDGE